MPEDVHVLAEAPFAVELPPAPFPGLRPFEKHEWPLFFGRESMTTYVIDRLMATHFVVVHGDSGCGKSSLIRAGVQAQLEQEQARSGYQWITADMRPGDAPLWGLATALARGQGAQVARDVRRLLNRGREAAPALTQALGLTEHQHLCVLIDQFEELFRFAKEIDIEEARLFTDVLVGLERDPSPDLYVVLTMRSEFLGYCARFRGLAETINRSQYLLPRMERPALVRAIREPARLYGRALPVARADALIDDAGGEQDQLPLIQHGLLLWWKGGECDKTTTANLADLLSHHADDVMQSVAPDEQRGRIVEHLFRALTDINAEGQAIRRPRTYRDLVRVTGSDTPTLEVILNAFRADGVSFLTPYGQASLTDETPIDISHEALIRCWRKIADAETGWLHREFQDGLTWQSLRVQAEAFQHNPEQVLSAAATTELETWIEQLPSPFWCERYGGGWQEVQALMEASRQARAKQLAEHQARLRQARVLALVFIIAFAITAVLGGWAYYERVQSQHHADRAEAQKTLAEAATKEAQQQTAFAQAEKLHRTRQFFDASLTHAGLLAQGEDYAKAREILRQTVKLDQDISETRRHARNLLAGAVDMLGSSADKVYRGAGAPLTGGVAVSPDGRWLAAAGERGTLVLFDAESGALVQQLTGHDPNAGTNGSIFSVVFDPKGSQLYSGGSDRRIIRWSVPDGKKLDEWQTPAEVRALAINPDGKHLASGGTDKAVTLWSTETGKRLGPLEGHTAAIAAGQGLDFSLSGEQLASASYDGTARIWDVNTRSSLAPLNPDTAVHGVVFSPDGKQVATAGQDKNIILWDAVTGKRQRTFTGHHNTVFAVAFDATGRSLLSSSEDRTLRLWDAVTGVTLRVYQGHTAGLMSVVRHGDTLYTAASDQIVHRWSLATPGQWMWELPKEPVAVALSPDASLVAVGFASGTLRVYDRGTGAEYAVVQKAHGSTITRLAFNAAGTLLASASFDKTAKLWQVDRTPTSLALTPLHTLEGHKDALHAVAFAPDGRTLATASYDGQVGLFVVETGKGELFEAHNGRVAHVAFTRDGQKLLSTGIGDFTLRLWDLTTRPPKPNTIAKGQDKLLWAALRPDGRQLAAVGRGSNVTLHNLGPAPAEPRRLVGHENAVYHAIYSPDGGQLATVSSDRTVRLWDLETNTELFALRLPTEDHSPSPLWDFDFRCTAQGECWIAVPLIMGRLVLYRLPYDTPPHSLTKP